jgi:hypothetical protein
VRTPPTTKLDDWSGWDSGLVGAWHLIVVNTDTLKSYFAFETSEWRAV